MYLLLCLFSSAMAVLALSSWAAKQGSGFAVDELTGQLTGIGDYRRAVVQAGAAAIGILVAILLSNIDYRSLVNVWPVHVVLTWGLVLPTLIIRNVTIGPLTIGYNAGDTDNYSWYKLGGFTLQPTELAKISFILTFAMHLNNVRTRLNEPKELGKLLLHLAVPILIIHVQGDDGTAIIYAIIGCCMMFAAGLSWKYILGAVSAAAVAMATAFAFFSDKIGKGYQWYRILAVIDPDNKTGWAPSETIWKNIIYQQQRGEIALGSGGIFGNGLFGGSYYSVPNAHNDFILSWIGNAAGFVGCCVVLGVLFALVIKTFLTGARSEDLLGTFICAGIGGALLAQIAVNVGMNLLKMDSTLNVNAVCEGIRDVFRAGAKLSADDAEVYYLRYMNYVLPEKARAYEEQFLADFAKSNRSYARTPSGVTYAVEVLGDQEQIPVSDRDSVALRYIIRTADGADVYSSYERRDTLRTSLGSLNKGMKESVKLIGKGGKINAWMPSAVAYGSAGDKELGIRPNATLYYEIELVDLDKYTNWSRRNNLRR